MKKLLLIFAVLTIAFSALAAQKTYAASVNLKVNGQPPYPALPALYSPASVILTWTTQDVDNCYATEYSLDYAFNGTDYFFIEPIIAKNQTHWFGGKPKHGFAIINDLRWLNSGYGTDYIFTLTCYTANSVPISTLVDQGIIAPLFVKLDDAVDIKVNGSDSPMNDSITVQEGMPVNLTWSSNYNVSCTAVGDWSGGKNPSGSETVYLTASKTFYSFGLKCEGFVSSYRVQGVDGAGVNVAPRDPNATLAISPSSAAIEYNGNVQLNALYDPDGSGPQTPFNVNQAAVWTSDDSSVAIVGSGGLATGKKENSDTVIRAAYVGLTAEAQIHVNYAPIYKAFYAQLKGVRKADVSVGDPPAALGTINLSYADCSAFSPFPPNPQGIEVGASCRNYNYLDVNFTNSSNPLSCPPPNTAGTRACILKDKISNNVLTVSNGYSFIVNNWAFFQGNGQDPYQIDADNSNVYVAWAEKQINGSSWLIKAASANSDFGGGQWRTAVIKSFTGNNDLDYPLYLSDFQFRKEGERLYFFWVMTSTNQFGQKTTSYNYLSTDLYFSSPIPITDYDLPVMPGAKSRTIENNTYTVYFDSSASRFVVEKMIFNCYENACSGSSCDNTIRFNCFDWSQGIIPPPEEVNFGINDLPIAPWIQSVGTDLRWDNLSGFTNPLPAANKYTSIPMETGRMPGIVFSGGKNGISPSFGKGQASANQFNWKVGSPLNPDTFTDTHGLIPTSYRFLLETAQGSGISPAALDSIDSSLEHGIYQTAGDLTISSRVTFRTDCDAPPCNYIILVNGDLNINAKITVPAGSTAIFSASGNIKADRSLGETPASSAPTLEGLYSADNNFIADGANDCSSGADKRLNIAGSVIANAGRGISGTSGTFVNNRTLCKDNWSNPSVSFIERPDFILNYPSMVKQIVRAWQDVAP